MSADLAVVPDLPDTAAVPGIRIDDVIVGERARKDYGDLTGLMQSIREVGLLQPIGLAPGNHLLFGGRRLEACRALGWESIPVVRPETREDALSLLTAERDENTCRKDMTLSELVGLGRRIEEMERPAAEARMLAGVSLDPARDRAQGRDHANETRRRVGDALGISGATYERAKKVLDLAEDETVPEETRAVARQAAKEMDETGKAWKPFQKIQAALNPQRPPRKPTARGLAKGRRPEILRRTHRADARRVITATVDGYANSAVPQDLLAEIDLGDAARLVDRFGTARGGVAGLLNRAQSIRMKTGNAKAHCVAAAAVEIYNAGRGGKKLASWWREDSELELVRDSA